MYFYIENNEIIGAGTAECATDTVLTIPVSSEIYTAWKEDNDKVIYNGTDIIVNPDYEEIKQQKERLRLDALTLTPADVERALYTAKGIDFDDLKTMISQAIPSIDIKGLAIEFRAKDFYRGAEANGMRLFDVVGQLLGYTTDDIDYLFKYKSLPNGENPDV